MNGFRELLVSVGEISALTVASVRELFKRPFESRLIVHQLEQGGYDSWSITVLAAGFTGMVLSLQFAIGLEPFGASMYTGKLVSLGIVRELGPVLTALLVGGRVGSGYTAEIGSMNVTEQVDAIRALGADPVRKLVMPRVVAMTIALPLLTIMADIVGCLSGAFITMLEVGVTFRFVFDQMTETLWVVDLLHGLSKSVFFGYLIGVIGCWNGLRTFGGTEGVGIATTRTVVYISIAILVSDFALTRIFLAIYG
ncbi:MAG: transporter [Deltaproteobacteria bacterium]|nr:transporter [Deltaproteobacteria bacterium]